MIYYIPYKSLKVGHEICTCHRVVALISSDSLYSPCSAVPLHSSHQHPSFVSTTSRASRPRLYPLHRIRRRQRIRSKRHRQQLVHKLAPKHPLNTPIPPQLTSSIVLTTQPPSPSPKNIKTGALNSKNSLNACLHIPHGLAGPPVLRPKSVTTPIARKSPRRRPMPPTAVPSAQRSAQVPEG